MTSKLFKIGLIALIPLHVFLSIFYSLRLPWGEDEWYTYYGTTIMAVPNTLLVNLLKSILGPVSQQTYLYYRQIGLFWVIISFLFLIYIIIRNSSFYIRRVALFLYIYIILSSFIIFQEQYFRYYGFYLFCSFVIFFATLLFNSDYKSKRKYFYTMLLSSPFLYFLITWQLFCYILFQELLSASQRTRIAIMILLALSAMPIILFWKPLMALVMSLGYIGNSPTSMEMRGINLAMLIKPIYAVFQFIFGYDVEPTENIFIIGLVFVMGLSFFYRIYQFYSENPSIVRLFIFAGLIPFLSVYWLIEPLTLSGAPQFESKHAIFFLPFFLSIFVPVNLNKNKIVNYFPALLVILSVSIGLFISLNAIRINWPHVVQMSIDVQKRGGLIVLDGRAEKTFLFYGNKSVDPDRVYSIYNSEKLEHAIKSSQLIMTITYDWKSYQVLTKQQNWNTGAGTVDRFHAVSELFSLLRKYDKRCIDSYVYYPLFSYVYQDSVGQSYLNQPQPVFFQIPYKDVYLPITKENIKIYGWEDVTTENSFNIEVDKPSNISIFYFIGNASTLKYGMRIGKLDFGTSEIPLLLGKAYKDKYQNVYSRGLDKADVWYVWKKRPVFTYSLRYPGSLFSSEGYIYKSNFSVSGKGKIVIEAPNVVLHLCAIRVND